VPGVWNPVEVGGDRLHPRLVPDEPELHVIKLPDLLGDESRAKRARQADESRSRYREHLADVLGGLDLASSDIGAVAEAVLDALFVVEPVDGGGVCGCSCHPRLPDSDQHDHGFDCTCRHTAEENRARWDELFAEMDAFWQTAEGAAQRAREAQEQGELDAWLAANPGVTVATRGGFAPEQWRGEVDGHSFFFRERHDLWRIELDLRPSGRFYRVWDGTGDLGDDASFKERESEEGDVIAEGTTAIYAYGTTPVERAQFIVGTIRDHLRRVDCTVHNDDLDDLESACGRPLNWCPACGAPLHGGRPWSW
jgi:hypothetical protein